MPKLPKKPPNSLPSVRRVRTRTSLVTAYATSQAGSIDPTLPLGPMVSGRRERILSPEELKADIKQWGKEISATPESAQAFLKRAGIIDGDGRWKIHVD